MGSTRRIAPDFWWHALIRFLLLYCIQSRLFPRFVLEPPERLGTRLGICATPGPALSNRTEDVCISPCPALFNRWMSVARFCLAHVAYQQRLVLISCAFQHYHCYSLVRSSRLIRRISRFSLQDIVQHTRKECRQVLPAVQHPQVRSCSAVSQVHIY